ncbi:DNA/RNA non-specific endonuclease [Achromobacter deleyi]|uniref:DNA/RNA non-specific endonuclease n=1 Tax=Achromobacter deleyi TaxID=1353891 RepID=A0A7T4AZY3_9BURK|nr:DNA/RNA non-specific endonuclease [Achromobacter deleyi]QQB33179.1 DNA/RNA non-specific endonuclease [Achromobacter deleyi]
MKLPVDLLAQALAAYPKRADEVAALRQRNAAESARQLDGAEHFARRRAMIAASARESADLAFERYIGTNDLLPSNYLLSGYLHALSVGRIRYLDRTTRRTAYATGFMVTPELMITNHHVFPVATAAEFAAFADGAVIEFGYEYDVLGRLQEPVAHALDPETFLHTHAALDLALVAVRPLDVGGRRALADQGYLVLDGSLGKAGAGDYATIVQHPDGREKQVALRNNEIVDNSLADVLIYQSDTAPGSSGAAVFNNEWQVIALHSAGVARQDASGNYLDRDGQIIPVENGRVDESRLVWLSNRGIRVSAIVAYLLSPASQVDQHPLIQTLRSPAYTNARPFTAAALPVLPAQELTRAAAPAATAAPAPIEIRIRISADQPVAIQALTDGAPPQPLAFEKKGEDAQDYAACLGYDDQFMGIRLPLPAPNAALRKKLARRGDAPADFVLKYHHFSALQHAVRRVPVLSAINVYGKQRYAELDDSTRKDRWLRDNRIDYDAQLDDAWYAKSGFDRGHLSRREDAEWGPTLAAAKTAADMTCSYANAVPQVPAFNRAIMGYHGQWGRLEQMLLEQGVEGESGKSARICVYSGPIFLNDDPVYASVQVALSCFKVVAWFDARGALRATGFRLSQEKLVDGIDFEVLHFDKLFKMQQKPLAWIEGATGLAFPQALRDADTHDAASEAVDDAAIERLLTLPEQARD